MPNKHAAIKDLRKNRKHAAHNERIKRHIRFLTKKNETAVKAGNSADVQQTARTLQQALDKAAKAGVLSRNKAARKKATLMKTLAAK